MSFENVDLPVTPSSWEDEPKPETEAAADTLDLRPTRGQVLVVEDDPTHRELLVELLTGWGYEPVAVGSAEEAEHAMRRRALQAAVVDVFLPGKSGASLLTRLRARFPESILIGISALGGPSTARRFKGLGADLFLTKPVLPEQLAKALQGKHQSWH